MMEMMKTHQESSTPHLQHLPDSSSIPVFLVPPVPVPDPTKVSSRFSSRKVKGQLILSGQNPSSAVLTPPSVTPTHHVLQIRIPGHMEPLRSDSPPDQYQPAHRRVSRERSISTPTPALHPVLPTPETTREMTRSTSPHISTMGLSLPHPPYWNQTVLG